MPRESEVKNKMAKHKYPIIDQCECDNDEYVIVRNDAGNLSVLDCYAKGVNADRDSAIVDDDRCEYTHPVYKVADMPEHDRHIAEQFLDMAKDSSYMNQWFKCTDTDVDGLNYEPDYEVDCTEDELVLFMSKYKCFNCFDLGEMMTFPVLWEYFDDGYYGKKGE